MRAEAGSRGVYLDMISYVDLPRPAELEVELQGNKINLMFFE